MAEQQKGAKQAEGAKDTGKPSRSQQNDEEPPHRIFASQAGVEAVAGEKPPTGYMTSMMHLVKCYVGTGIFAMGEGFKHCGLITGPIMLTIIALMNLNCQHILVKTCAKIAEQETEQVKPTFAETVQYTMEASKLKCLKNNSVGLGWSITIFLCACELGFCCVYFVFIAQHLLAIAHTHEWLDRERPESIHIVLCIILIPMWISTFLGNLKLLLPLSVISNVLLWTGIAIILVFVVKDPLPPIDEDKDMVASYKYWPLFFGTALFAFEGINFILPLRNEMRNPQQFSSLAGVLNVGMTFVTILYILVGLLGYLKWGNEVKSSVFLNLTEEHAQMADVTNAIMAVAILFTFTLHMYIPFEITFPLFYRKYGPFKYGRLVMYIFRSMPVLLTFTLANVVPFLGLFISLIGATAGSFLALIMPPILELIAFQEELSVLMIIKDIIIISTGICGTITGTTLSILEIIEKFRVEYFGYEP